MSKLHRSGLNDLVPRTLATLRTAAAELPSLAAVGTQVLRTLLIFAAVPTGCVAHPVPVTVRLSPRVAPGTIAMVPAGLAQPLSSLSHRGDWA